MEREFPTYEEAELYASGLRSEGYMAAVRDRCVASLWGPTMTHGFHVIVSETTGDDRQEVAPPGRFEKIIRGIIRYSLLAVAAMGFAWLLFQTCQFLLNQDARFFVLSAIFALAGACFLYSMAAWSMFLSVMIGKKRDAGSATSLIIHALVSFIASGLIVMFVLLGG